ncbi:hypothetical protein ACF082_29935 [Streptomyces lydicus]|uniref:hypothetical protein n=1 Tax=Streptomyces lydicus TaxID=47763 RepID=UPI0036FD1484
MTNSAAKAAAILREDAPHSPAEQAAMDALNEELWVLWHAEDYRLGVVRMLHRASLLRDKNHEDHQNRTAVADARLREQARVADQRAFNDFDTLIDQAAQKLEEGTPPAEVAAWLRDTRGAIHQQRDKRRSIPVDTNDAAARRAQETDHR